MTDATVTVEPTAATPTVAQGERNPFPEVARKVLLAGIGAVALAQDEIEEFVAKLVERGELAEADGRKLVKDMIERRKQQIKEESRKAESLLDRRLEAILARMDLPTRQEVAALNERIAELTRKIEELKQTA
jgi:poly(hydroxyalkanoate) granule-associated protein